MIHESEMDMWIKQCKMVSKNLSADACEKLKMDETKEEKKHVSNEKCTISIKKIMT